MGHQASPRATQTQGSEPFQGQRLLYQSEESYRPLPRKVLTRNQVHRFGKFRDFLGPPPGPRPNTQGGLSANEGPSTQGLRQDARQDSISAPESSPSGPQGDE